MNKPACNNITTEKKQSQRIERILGLIALFTIIGAWAIGIQKKQIDLEPVVSEMTPRAGRFIKITDDRYAVYSKKNSEEITGYVGVTDSNGFGGPMTCAALISTKGDVLKVKVLQHRETPSWYEKVINSSFVSSLIGKSHKDSFQKDLDIDTVTGATYTSLALADSVRKISRDIAVKNLKLSPPAEGPVQIIFGIPETILILLFLMVLFIWKSDFKYKKQARWVTMITGLILIGISFNRPLSIVQINKMLMGFWPQWQTGIYWYILIFGIAIIFLITQKNAYCQWFCPFGAAQECVNAVGGARISSAGRYHTMLTWFRRGLVWFALVISFLFQNPSIGNYEIFGTAFSLMGAHRHFLLLSIILLSSLFIKRPWCKYLCAISTIEEYIRMMKKWMIEIWQKKTS